MFELLDTQRKQIRVLREIKATLRPIELGRRIVFGVRPPLPIINAPPGRQRLKMRNKSAARLYVKTDSSIREFVLEDRGDHWFVDPKLEQGSNHKQKP